VEYPARIWVPHDDERKSYLAIEQWIASFSLY